MTDGGAVFRPNTGRAPVPLRPRSVYAELDAFGDGDGAVLVESRVSRNLRLAAEFATQEGRIAGGLLYGRGFVDEKGAYLVVSGYLEAGPGENRGDRVHRARNDQFTLSDADLRLLRKDASRMYTSSAEVGWWRSLPAAGEFGPKDLQTQAALVGPGGAGLLVFGSGLDWGTAYLGPAALSPDPPGLVLPPEPASESPDDLEPEAVPAVEVAEAVPAVEPVPAVEAVAELSAEPGPEAEPALEAEPVPDAEPDLMADLGFHVVPDPESDPGFDPDMEQDPDMELERDVDFDRGTEPVTGAGFDPGAEPGSYNGFEPGTEPGDYDDIESDAEPDVDEPPATRPLAPVTSLATRRQPVLTPAPEPSGPREMSPVLKPEREWGAKEHNPSYVGPETPTDVKIVVGLLCLVVIIAAIMIGMLVHYALAAVIVGVVGLLVICAFLWFSRL
jgi:hypothetical protein